MENVKTENSIKSLNGKTLSLQDLFEAVKKDKKQIVIPLYQRNYRWGKEKVERYWNDAKNCSEDKAYNIGIITIKLEGDKVYLIDGQQRFITTLLILKKFGKMKESAPEFVFERDRKNENPRLKYLSSDTISESVDVKSVDVTRMMENLSYVGEDENIADKMLKNFCVLIRIVDGEPVDEYMKLNGKKTPFTVADTLKALMIIDGHDNGNEDKIYEVLSAFSALSELMFCSNKLPKVKGFQNNVDRLSEFFEKKYIESEKKKIPEIMKSKYLPEENRLDAELKYMRNQYIYLSEYIEKSGVLRGYDAGMEVKKDDWQTFLDKAGNMNDLSKDVYDDCCTNPHYLELLEKEKQYDHFNASVTSIIKSKIPNILKKAMENSSKISGKARENYNVNFDNFKELLKNAKPDKETELPSSSTSLEEEKEEGKNLREKKNLKELFNSAEKIYIPAVQRDYVMGGNKKYVKKFLAEINRKYIKNFCKEVFGDLENNNEPVNALICDEYGYNYIFYTLSDLVDHRTITTDFPSHKKNAVCVEKFKLLRDTLGYEPDKSLNEINLNGILSKIKELTNNHANAIKESEEMNLSAMIVHKDGKNLYIYDGQQRLITLSITAAVLYTRNGNCADEMKLLRKIRFQGRTKANECLEILFSNENNMDSKIDKIEEKICDATTYSIHSLCVLLNKAFDENSRSKAFDENSRSKSSTHDPNINPEFYLILSADYIIQKIYFDCVCIGSLPDAEQMFLEINDNEPLTNDELDKAQLIHKINTFKFNDATEWAMRLDNEWLNKCGNEELEMNIVRYVLRMIYCEQHAEFANETSTIFDSPDKKRVEEAAKRGFERLDEIFKPNKDIPKAINPKDIYEQVEKWYELSGLSDLPADYDYELFLRLFEFQCKNTNDKQMYEIIVHNIGKFCNREKVFEEAKSQTEDGSMTEQEKLFKKLAADMADEDSVTYKIVKHGKKEDFSKYYENLIVCPKPNLSYSATIKFGKDTYSKPLISTDTIKKLLSPDPNISDPNIMKAVYLDNKNVIDVKLEVGDITPAEWEKVYTDEQNKSNEEKIKEYKKILADSEKTINESPDKKLDSQSSLYTLLWQMKKIPFIEIAKGAAPLLAGQAVSLPNEDSVQIEPDIQNNSIAAKYLEQVYKDKNLYDHFARGIAPSIMISIAKEDIDEIIGKDEDLKKQFIKFAIESGFVYSHDSQMSSAVTSDENKLLAERIQKCVKSPDIDPKDVNLHLNYYLYLSRESNTLQDNNSENLKNTPPDKMENWLQNLNDQYKEAARSVLKFYISNSLPNDNHENVQWLRMYNFIYGGNQEHCPKQGTDCS